MSMLLHVWCRPIPKKSKKSIWLSRQRDLMTSSGGSSLSSSQSIDVKPFYYDLYGYANCAS